MVSLFPISLFTGSWWEVCYRWLWLTLILLMQSLLSVSLWPLPDPFILQQFFGSFVMFEVLSQGHSFFLLRGHSWTIGARLRLCDMILIQAFSRREALFLLYRLYCRRLGASSSKAVEQREYSSSLVRRGGLKAAPLKTSMTPASSKKNKKSHCSYSPKRLFR